MACTSLPLAINVLESHDWTYDCLSSRYGGGQAALYFSFTLDVQTTITTTVSSDALYFAYVDGADNFETGPAIDSQNGGTEFVGLDYPAGTYFVEVTAATGLRDITLTVGAADPCVLTPITFGVEETIVLDLACDSVRFEPAVGRETSYFSYTLTEISTVTVTVTAGLEPHYIATVNGNKDFKTGAARSSTTGSFTFVDVCPAGDFFIEIVPNGATATVTVTKVAGGCPELEGPGDAYCISEVGAAQTQLLPASVNTSVFNGDNTGFSVELGEQLSLTNPTSFQSFWLAVDQLFPGRVYTFTSDGVSLMELYDQADVGRDISTLSLSTSKNVTGQGTSTLTFEYGGSVYPDKALIRIFVTTDGTGAAFTVTSVGTPTTIQSDLLSVSSSSDAQSEHLVMYNYGYSDSILDSAMAFLVGRYYLAKDTFTNADANSFSTISVKNISDSTILLDKLYQVFLDSINDTKVLTATSTFDVAKIIAIIDTIIADENINHNLVSINHLALILTFRDLINSSSYLSVTEQALFQDSIVQLYVGYVDLIDGTLFAAELNTLAFVIINNDSMLLDDSLSNTALFKNLLKDSFGFFGGLNLFGQNYLAYTLNTQSLGIAEYNNYNFNSFSYPLAATADGIYSIDDSGLDDGVDIDASIKTGLVDFGTSLKKQVPYAYIGITSEDSVVMKVISTQTGSKKERWYEVRPHTATLDTARVKMGKGVKARYWQFELTNINGGLLDIESIELLPVILKRRKQ